MGKFAIITSVSPGYMFAANCVINANEFYKTNADVHLLYQYMEPEYIEKSKKEKYPFSVTWVPMTDVSNCFHTSKYGYVQKICNDYDSVCLIDADLFIITNLTKYFEMSANEDILITATHLWSGGDPDRMPWDNWVSLDDRGKCQLADFPVFVNGKNHLNFFGDWFNGASERPDIEYCHPLVSFNRAVCKNFRREQIIPLSGTQWICDMEYWIKEYNWRKNSWEMVDNQGNPIFAIHNKWWKEGRANGEWLAHRKYAETHPIITNLNRGEHNFNEIRNAMVDFNNLRPSVKREDYLKDRIDRKIFLDSWYESNPHLKEERGTIT